MIRITEQSAAAASKVATVQWLFFKCILLPPHTACNKHPQTLHRKLQVHKFSNALYGTTYTYIHFQKTIRLNQRRRNICQHCIDSLSSGPARAALVHKRHAMLCQGHRSLRAAHCAERPSLLLFGISCPHHRHSCCPRLICKPANNLSMIGLILSPAGMRFLREFAGHVTLRPIQQKILWLLCKKGSMRLVLPPRAVMLAEQQRCRQSLIQVFRNQDYPTV